MEMCSGRAGKKLLDININIDTIQTMAKIEVYKTPWQGDPRINMQNHKGKAKAYQVKQVLLAIEKLEVEHAAEK
jgi:hypothetical protein